MTALAISGGYADDAFQFQFRLGQEAPAAAVPPTQRAVVLDPTTPHGLATVIAQTTARVVHSYGFKDFKQVAITDVASDVSWAVPEDQLPMYRRRQVPLIPSAPP